MTRVLIVDDDPVQLRLASDLVTEAGFLPVTVMSGDEALGVLRSGAAFTAVLLDLVMPDLDGLAVLSAMRREAIAVPTIVAATAGSTDSAMSAVRLGAVDFVVKPFAHDRVAVSLRNAARLTSLETLVRSSETHRAGTASTDDIASRSPAMHRVLGLVKKAAKSELPVLIEGEAGTGKEHLARIIHGAGDRAARPFVSFDCAAHRAEALEAALFGTKENDSGAVSGANGGTLFVNGLGECPPNIQVKLVQLLEHGRFEPASGGQPQRANIRLIAGTRQRLLALARSGDIREDLYYRLNVLPTYLPALRERPEDIEALALRFARDAAIETQRRVVSITPKAIELLQGYDWPANIRQLEALVYRAVLLAEHDQLAPADFPQLIARRHGTEETRRMTASLPLPSAPVHIDAATPRIQQLRVAEAPDRFLDANGSVRPITDIERELIVFALRQHGGHMSRVARALGIGRSTLYRKLREYGLEEAEQSDAA